MTRLTQNLRGLRMLLRCVLRSDAFLAVYAVAVVAAMFWLSGVAT